MAYSGSLRFVADLAFTCVSQNRDVSVTCHIYLFFQDLSSTLCEVSAVHKFHRQQHGHGNRSSLQDRRAP